MAKKELKIFSVFLVFFCSLPFYAFAKEMAGSMVSISKNLPDNVTILVRDKNYTASKDEIQKWLGETTSLIYDSKYLSEFENTDFCLYKKSLICELSFLSIKKAHIKRDSAVRIDESAIERYIAALALKANVNAEDAKLKMEEGKVSAFSTGTKGIEINEEKGSRQLVEYIAAMDFSKPLSIAYTEKDPKISNIDSIEELGVNELIGQGRSNFRGSPKNRIFNIKVATNRFNGVLIKPGEEFSFVSVLGEVDGDHGYLPELVIKKDKTEPEFGGGICQVS
ncbi:MAG TPA: VanW family protein, partial [Patescibacteria group bacterium]|nr:VanW family protein [Patescibacteria group bacterium]